MARNSGTKNHSLARRLTRRLIAIGACFTMGFLLLVGFVVHDRFSALEEREVASHFARADSLLADIQKNVLARSLDWAVWDDPYVYLEDGNQNFIAANLGYTSIFNLNANGLAYVRFDRTFADARYADYKAGGNSAIKAEQFLAFAQQKALSDRARKESSFSTFVRQGDRVLAVSVAQVLHSDGTGPTNGYLVLGREITNAEITSALALPAKIRLNDLAPSRSTQTQWNANTMRVPLTGIDGQPVAEIEFMAPRSLAAEGRVVLLLTVLGALLAGLLLVAMLGRSIRNLVIQPLETFQAHVAGISDTGDLCRFEATPRDDELGLLHAEFNSMIDELVVLRAKVERQSYIIGKRDNAVSVMHNIGNGIGPVKTILSKLEALMVIPARQDVNRAFDELGSNHESGSRPARLIEFARAAFSLVCEAAIEQKELVRTALRSVDTVEGIISAQMEESRNDPIRDSSVSISPILANAVELARQRGPHVAIDLHDDSRLTVRGNAVLLAQVMENLLKNAHEAICAAGAASGEIDVVAAAEMQGPFPMLRVTISDNGDGFETGMASQFFEKGRSSRNKAVGGLGLHWCANTINAMGGRLTLESDGPGRGARAVIELPLDVDQTAPAPLAA